MANGKLAKEAARDTGDATTAELLAEPQNVINAAYDTLRSARYPLNLPFDMWLETVRKFCDYFETPLHRVLEVIRPDDDLFALVEKPTNVGNATVSVANGDAAKLAKGGLCTFFPPKISSLNGETKRISDIGAADSGGGGQTTITFVGTWKSAPVAGDRLVFHPLDGRAAIFMESLGLSPAEIGIFADADPLPDWHTLYGFEDTREMRQALTPPRPSRDALGVTYKETMEIVQTGFVNPELGKLSVLYKLDVSVRDAKLYQAEKALYDTNKDLLGKARNMLSAINQQRFDELAKKRPNSEVTGLQVLNEVAALVERLAQLSGNF